MKERGIIFNGEEVRAALEGRKTQFRRPVKPQPAGGVRRSPFSVSGIEDLHGRAVTLKFWPLDRLYVKETWAEIYEIGKDGLQTIYRADENNYGNKPWRSAATMPRWASRITLEITGVRVERVQGISQGDAHMEGFFGRSFVYPQEQFKEAWNSLYAKRGLGWDANPLCWIIEFRRIE